MRLKHAPNEGNVGFQIAPMIDVVFVIMLFFMVMAGSVKVEKELNTTLPGTADTSTSTDFVDEQIITIGADGENSHEAKSQLAITIASEPEAKYGRAIDVLNALAAAKIDNVTFTVDDDEQ